MFDAISVSQRTRKPWTVAVSFTGQMAAIGLAMLVPLVSTDGLPHPLSWVSVPQPPRGVSHPASPAPAKPVKTVPFLRKADGFHYPVRIPDRVATIVDLEAPPSAASSGPGVVGGIPDAASSANSVINSLVSRLPETPPPAPAARPSAAPKPIERIKVGGMVQKGKLISGPLPVYPPLARTARVEGTVRMAAVIARDGTVIDLRVVSGHPMLVQAALAAVRNWVFRPTTLNGDAVEVATEIEVNFVLEKR